MLSDVTDVWPHDLVTLIIVLRLERKIIWEEKEKEKKNNLESTVFSFDITFSSGFLLQRNWLPSSPVPLQLLKILILKSPIIPAKQQLLLWQPLDQYPIVALQVNLKSGYLVGNMSCVIHKKTQQGTTTVFYWLFIYNYLWSVLWLHICCVSYPNVHVLSSCPLLIYLMFYYSSTIHLS